MDDLPFRLKNWSYKDFLEEIEEMYIPSDQESVVDTDNEESELPEQNLQDEMLISDDSDVPNDDTEDLEEDDIPLSILRQQIIRDRSDVQEFHPPVWKKGGWVNIDPQFTHRGGPTDVIKRIESPTPYKYFNSLITDDIINYIVFQTNLYATQEGKRFTPTNVCEIKIFLGINILMGIKPLPSYRDYWSSSPDLHDEYISKLMPVNRFGWLLSHIHLSDNSLMPDRDQPNYDKLYKVRTFFNKISENFERCYEPQEKLAVDESMIRFKGRSSIKQYLPKKPIKRGYKVWCLADQSGYLYRFQIYTGKVGDKAEKNLGERVVKDLMRGLEHKNHRLFIDNYFCSYKLLLDLKNDSIWTCGTVLFNRKHIPQMRSEKELKRGDTDWKVSDTGLSIFKWKDKRSVHLLSNYHDPQIFSTVRRKSRNGQIEDINCPRILLDYNMNMGFVDKLDQLKSNFGLDRRSHKWWHRIFFHFIDICIVNSYILYKLNGQQISHKDFRRAVVTGLVAEKLVHLKTTRSSSPLCIKKHKPTVSMEIRLESSAHQPERSTRRRCAVCSTKQIQIRTEWTCSVCKVPLCLSKFRTCFQQYHQKVRI